MKRMQVLRKSGVASFRGSIIYVLACCRGGVAALRVWWRWRGVGGGRGREAEACRGSGEGGARKGSGRGAGRGEGAGRARAGRPSRAPRACCLRRELADLRAAAPARPPATCKAAWLGPSKAGRGRARLGRAREGWARLRKGAASLEFGQSREMLRKSSGKAGEGGSQLELVWGKSGARLRKGWGRLGTTRARGTRLDNGSARRRRGSNRVCQGSDKGRQDKAR